MAAYTDLLVAAGHDVLRQKVRVACFIAADNIRAESDTTPNHAARIAWAKSVFANPERAGEAMIFAVLAQNKTASLSAITSASDTLVQDAVDAAVAVFL